jgi:hypothetical protein
MPREAIAINPSSRASRMCVKANESLTGARSILPAEIEQYNGFHFTPTAARVVTMPDVSICKGVYFWIHNANAGAYALTCNDAATTLIVSVPANKCALFFSDGVVWSFQLGA